nr:uncharacterized protein LOC119179199 [Rhipicephalus microplus]
MQEYLLLHKKEILVSLPMKRRWQVRPLWMNRRVESEFFTLMLLLMAGDREYFKKYYRMTPETFEELHSLVEEPLTRMLVTRDPVPSKARLAITIRYLASGMYIQDVAMAFRVEISTAAGIIHFTCRLLWGVLQPVVLRYTIPTATRWQEIANDFCDKWNFPLCVGVVDGKHIQIQMPPHSGSLYYNYKVIMEKCFWCHDIKVSNIQENHKPATMKTLTMLSWRRVFSTTSYR